MINKLALVSLVLVQSSMSWSQETPPPETADSKLTDSKAVQPKPVEKNRYPLFFDVQDNELKIAAPQVSFDLQTSKGDSLDLGNGIVFNNESLDARIENAELILTWNAQLIPSGDLSIIDEQGKEIWKKALDTSGLWKTKALTGPEAPKWQSNDKFRFCLRQEKDKGYVSLCSQLYAIVIEESGLQLGKTRSSANARVIFQNQERKLKGSETVAAGSPVQFLATLNTNASYEFLSEPLNPVIRDMITTDETGKVALVGELPPPVKGEVSIVPGENYGKLTRSLGFEKTIAEKPDLWQINLANQERILSLPGKSGGVFSYHVTIKDPPTPQHRLYLETPYVGTYLSNDQFKFTDHDGNVKTFEFQAPEKFSFTKVQLESTANNQAHKSYLNIYRGSAGEASLRLTGVGTTDGSFVALGEGHISWWFNDLFGWQNNYLSKQRWGVSARMFTSLMEFPVKTSGGGKEDVSLSVMQADLRYRFNQGLWERDETLGAIVAYEAMTIDSDNVSKMGVGLFWARSMPRAIDAWISKLPYMNHPKWVDMEFITYLSSPDSDVQLKGDFLLNFHGKVLWTPRFFGEAGFGVKNYHYERASDGSGAKLTTFYGTLGVGLNF